MFIDIKFKLSSSGLDICLQNCLTQASRCLSGIQTLIQPDAEVVSVLGQSITHKELLYVADLFHSSRTSSDPVYRDSAYRLLEPWSHSGSQLKGQLARGFSNQGTRDLLYRVSRNFPITLSKQCEIVLLLWCELKFGVSMVGDNYLWEAIADHLGWTDEVKHS